MTKHDLAAHLQAAHPELYQMLTEVRRIFGPTPTPTIVLHGKVVWSPAHARRAQSRNQSNGS